MMEKVCSVLLSLLFSVSTTAKVQTAVDQKARQILFEYDLVDEEISAEGALFELYKDQYVCVIDLTAYKETGQYHAQFEFIEQDLVKIKSQDYAYKYGDFQIDNDRDGIEKYGYIDSDPSMLRLRESKVIYPEQDPEQVLFFHQLKSKIPQAILDQHCKS